MKKYLFLLTFLPVQAEAVDGTTVFEGPAVPILETVGQDFPRYDVVDLCKQVMPGTNSSAESAQATCKSRQARLAGLASHVWDQLPAATRANCLRRADAARGGRYYVLYSCVRAGNFRRDRQEAINRVAERIARQNGKVPVDSQTVGSIK